ncbi:type VII secretion-associated serine protease mycosin [Saccharopolyspora indica]|uniref:type VII secretion-associated serine protease mycosin n=1 Tax=Saccharopolyspora indica TaxID=1229659 RepID=UPI0022EAAB4D|nr:type VII secretion-associated serine protease mycosin [Saccharopolyspora indica]MDA3647204.1 type VII secretion-associated serine protease mycosin [Saccharopolyspora indica]
MKRLDALAATVLAVVALAFAAPGASAAPPAGACSSSDPARPVVAERPWAQQVLAPERVWPHSTGAGVLVAVVDSGVDADHPQLNAPGKVLPGRDFFLTGSLPGNYDCVSHGTSVASIIAGGPVDGVGFRGIAPGARILPVRVTDRPQSDSGEPTPIDPNTVAAGIRYAADQGAKVINLSLSGNRDFPAIRDAIAYAQQRDALIVAAVGNRQQETSSIPSYPAEHPGVLGVGSIDNTGARTGASQIGPYVDLVAPGKSVLAAGRVGGHDYWDGTSFAAPFVSGAAALVRAAWPDLTAPQVAQRLMATADLARGGRDSHEYGAGVVDPYRAVTEGLSGTPEAMPAVPTPQPDLAAEQEHRWWRQAGNAAVLAFGAVAVALVAVSTLTWLAARGHRRRWRPTRTVIPPAVPAREEPPEQMFLFPPPTSERPTQR